MGSKLSSYAKFKLFNVFDPEFSFTNDGLIKVFVSQGMTENRLTISTVILAYNRHFKMLIIMIVTKSIFSNE